jgi:hypothetical protein
MPEPGVEQARSPGSHRLQASTQPVRAAAEASASAQLASNMRRDVLNQLSTRLERQLEPSDG